MRDEFINNIPRALKLTKPQNDLLQRCLKLDSGEFTKLESSHRIQYSKRYAISADGKSSSGTQIGKVTADIDAAAADVLAWRW